MRPYPLGSLYESQNRIHQEFMDFAAQWQRTREGWRDEPARRFEQEAIASLAPTLTRVAAAMQSFGDACRQSDAALQDPEFDSSQA